MLCEIRSRDDVAGVYIEIDTGLVAEELDDAWPFADTVVVVTSAGADVVAQWKKSLHVDAAKEGLPRPPNSPVIPAGHAAWHFIWS